MDRGPLERQEADRIKDAIARSTQRKRRSRPSIGVLPPIGPNADGVQAQDERPSSDGTVPVTPVSLSQNYETVISLAHQGMVPDLSDLFSLTPLHYENHVTDPATWQDVIPYDLDETSGFAASSSELCSPSIGHPGRSLEPVPFPDNFWTDLAVDAQVHLTRGGAQPDLSNEVVATSNPLSRRQACDRGTSSILHNELPSTIWRANGPHSSNSPSLLPSSQSSVDGNGNAHCILGTSVQHALLLSYYVDTVLYVQFPFNKHRGGGSFQWLQFLLFSSELVLKISLVLSQAYHNLGIAVRHRDWPDGFKEHTAQAAEALKLLPSPAATLAIEDKRIRTTQIIVACTTLLQAIYIEGFYGRLFEWKHLLQQAKPYIHSLVQLLESEKIDDAEPRNAAEPASQMYATAAKELLSHLVWFDIVSTLSSGDRFAFGVNHIHLLDCGLINIERVSGCHERVVIALCDIYTLRRWKQQAESCQKLSVFELATRAAAIHETLNNIVSQLGDANSVDAQQANANLTHVYARAMIVYLHVVTSGPYPQLLDIRRAVIDLIEQLKVIAGIKMLAHASWPLCVAACFADADERRLLRHLVSAGDGAQETHFRLCTEVLDVAQECHRIREVEGKACDWTAAATALRERSSIE